MEAWSKEEGGALGNREGASQVNSREARPGREAGGRRDTQADVDCAAGPGNARQSRVNSSERGRCTV